MWNVHGNACSEYADASVDAPARFKDDPCAFKTVVILTSNQGRFVSPYSSG